MTRNCHHCGRLIRSHQGGRAGTCITCRTGFDVPVGHRAPQTTARYASAEQIEALITLLKTTTLPESPGA